MFSKAKKTERIDAETREQYQYARARIKQKKRLMSHFIVFLVGSILFIILNVGLKMGEDFLIKDWFVWAILIWAFLFLIHVFNVFLMNKFMDKEWEDKQLEKLKAKQEKRIAELSKQVEKDMPFTTRSATETTNISNQTTTDRMPQDSRTTEQEKKSNNTNLLPPEEA